MISILKKNQSTDGSIKYAFRDENNNLFEAIYFCYSVRKDDLRKPYNICISTQAGCAMGCKFCATAYGGFYRNLSVENLIQQVNLVRKDIVKNTIEHPKRRFNLVLMGMGEPLMNYDNVIEFLYQISENVELLNKVLLSTVGISSRIINLAEDKKQLKLNLYLSVHSPYEDERSSIMPITEKYSLESCISACNYFSEKNKTIVKASYLLLKDINDSLKHAESLALILDPRRFVIQLNLYNDTPDLPFTRPDEMVAVNFRDKLRLLGYRAYIRTSSGRDINGGCGQFVKLTDKRGKHASK